MAISKQDIANMATKDDIKDLKADIAGIDARLGVVETKLDKALYKEIDLHERWTRLPKLFPQINV